VTPFQVCFTPTQPQKLKDPKYPENFLTFIREVSNASTSYLQIIPRLSFEIKGFNISLDEGMLATLLATYFDLTEKMNWEFSYGYNHKYLYMFPGEENYLNENGLALECLYTYPSKFFWELQEPTVSTYLMKINN
jgi:hypothetical protein